MKYKEIFESKGVISLTKDHLFDEEMSQITQLNSIG